MGLNFRQGEIVAIARASGRVVVDDLVSRCGVSNIDYAARARMNGAAKSAIGRACAAAIPDNASVILNLGTTTEAVARELLHHRNLTVVTNNMNVANILAYNPGCEVIVAGGALRRSD